MAAIRASRHFAHSERLCTFLDYVVERVLAGNGGGLKEHDLGVAVFRRPESYDPQIDPTVRVEARRLRAKLAAYYSDEGRQEPILIHLPKGGGTSPRLHDGLSERDSVRYW